MQLNSRHDGLITRLAIGSAAGLAGTFALHSVSAAAKKMIGETSPIRKDPGEFLIKKAEQLLPEQTRRQIPEKVEKVAAKALGFDYGMSFGAAYGLLRPNGGPVIADGVALGLANWAIGFLGWLPATKLAPPVWKQDAKQIIGPIVAHIVYGMVTVASYNALDRLAHRACESSLPSLRSSSRRRGSELLEY